MSVRFFCDRDVLRLAKWLRFVGFDVMTRRELSRHNIIRICQKDRRIFITRKKKDVSLLDVKVELLDSDDVFAQLENILAKYPIVKDNIGSRCIQCNVKLLSHLSPILAIPSDIDSDCNKDTSRFPSSIPTYLKGKSYKYCSRCSKIYWEGSHYKNMNEVINQLK